MNRKDWSRDDDLGRRKKGKRNYVKREWKSKSLGANNDDAAEAMSSTVCKRRRSFRMILKAV